uniref:Putative secreted peptide n=1 Tax=Anopheles braziliensis TaxID=58242 RepID=A0A2M3ZP30_9DIPT
MLLRMLELLMLLAMMLVPQMMQLQRKEMCTLPKMLRLADTRCSRAKPLKQTVKATKRWTRTTKSHPKWLTKKRRSTPTPPTRIQTTSQTWLTHLSRPVPTTMRVPITHGWICHRMRIPLPQFRGMGKNMRRTHLRSSTVNEVRTRQNHRNRIPEEATSMRLLRSRKTTNVMTLRSGPIRTMLHPKKCLMNRRLSNQRRSHCWTTWWPTRWYSIALETT